MAIKTAYKENPTIEIAAGEMPPEIAVTPDPLAPPEIASPQPNDFALKRQFENLQRAEDLQAANQRVDHWVRGNALAQRHHQLLGPLHEEALKADIPYASADYFSFMGEALSLIDKQEYDRQRTEPPPKFFEPRPKPQPSPRQVPVSAPVSRPDSPDTYKEPHEQRITLSSAEIEIATKSGISLAEYAKQKRRMLKAKAAGEIQ